MMNSRANSILFFLGGLLLTACGQESAPVATETAAPTPAAAETAEPAPVASETEEAAPAALASDRYRVAVEFPDDVYLCDAHVHTSMSLDAAAWGAKISRDGA